MSKKPIEIEDLPTLPPEVETIAANPSFNGFDTLAIAGRRIMALHAQKLYAHLPGVLAGDDPHDIHQMRVATRRLRASLEATAAAYDPDQIKSLYKRLRVLARALGNVRDRDVLLMRLRSDAERLQAEQHDRVHTALENIESEVQQSELHTVIERVQAERDTAHVNLLRELGRKRTRRLLNDLNTFLTAPLGDSAADQGGPPLLVRHHAGSTIWQQYEAVLRFETIMRDASIEQLHRLRIACKHLRYTLELFAPALGNNAGDAIKRVEAMQEHLGNLHDSDVAITYLRDTYQPIDRSSSADHQQSEDENPANQAFGIGEYINAREAECARLRQEVDPLWDRLTNASMRRTLARLIADL